jgi:exonuclease III
MVSRNPNVIALQEINSSTARQLAPLLTASGFPFQLHTCGHDPSPGESGARGYGELIASQWLLELIDGIDYEMPWPERLLSAVIHSPFGQIELHSAYVPPGSSHGWLKIETLEGIFKQLSHLSSRPRILCGDFNTPQAEREDGRVVTWGEYMTNGTIKLDKKRGKRWDQAERAILVGLAQFDLNDVFRTLHGYNAQEFSWYTTRKGKITARRFDHVFASGDLNAVSCRYVHSFREQGLSDHSPIEACFQPS